MSVTTSDYSGDALTEKLQEIKTFYDQYNYPDGTDKRKKYWADHFAKHVDLSSLKGKKILDVGCGQGTISQMLCEHGADVYSMDLSSTAVNYVKSHYPQLNVREASALDIPFEDETFDMVVSIGVLMITPDPYKGFTECIRVTKTGGIFIPLLYAKWHPYPIIYKYGRHFIGGNSPETANKYLVAALRKFTAWYYGEEWRAEHDAVSLIADQFYTPLAKFYSVRTIKNWGEANDLRFRAKSTTFYGEHIMYSFSKGGNSVGR